MLRFMDSILFWSIYLVTTTLAIYIIFNTIKYIYHYIKYIIIKCKRSEYSKIELVMIRDSGEKLELIYKNESIYLHEISTLIDAPLTKDSKKKFERKYMTQLITLFLNDTKLLRNDFDNLVNKVPMSILEKDVNGKEIIAIENKVYLAWKQIINLLHLYHN